MKIIISLLALIGSSAAAQHNALHFAQLGKLTGQHAPPTPLVTGNGFGFAVYSFDAKAISKFYAHPYRFEKHDPNNEWAEGIETTNFIKSLSWDKPSQVSDPGDVQYLQDSQVISVNNEEYYFHPFGLRENAFVASSTLSTCLNPEWAHPLISEEFRGNAIVLKFKDVAETMLLIPLDHGISAQASGTMICGSHSWVIASVEAGKNWNLVLDSILEWTKGDSSDVLIQHELSSLENWRVQPTVQFHSHNEFRLWRQSEVVLRMAQIREPNHEGRVNHGLILASLPEGMWFVSWVRDMAYATLGLIRMGHMDEARRAVLAYFNARPMGRMSHEVRDFPYQISVVRYFGDGSEEPFFTMEGEPNIEYDNWGLVLWVLSEYVNKFNDPSILYTPTYRGTVYEVARDLIATPLLGNLDATEHGNIVTADTSIWEEYQWAKKHFSFSSAAAINGLKHFAGLSKIMNDTPTGSRLEGEISKLEMGFKDAFINDGFISGTSEHNYKNDIDSASLEAINFGIVTDENVITKTMAQMELLKMPSGGYRRVRGETDYEKQEFLYSNFSMSRNYLRLGKAKMGFPFIDEMVSKCDKDHNLIPEMYVSEKNDLFPGQIGDPTGSIPMVGYGAGIYVIYLLERQSFTK